jgi:hypothetical protein
VTEPPNFRTTVLQDTLLQVHTYNVLLHLCSGGNQAEDGKKRVFADQSAEVCQRSASSFCLSLT